MREKKGNDIWYIELEVTGPLQFVTFSYIPLDRPNPTKCASNFIYIMMSFRCGSEEKRNVAPGSQYHFVIY